MIFNAQKLNFMGFSLKKYNRPIQEFNRFIYKSSKVVFVPNSRL